jgi:hypothetical protein
MADVYAYTFIIIGILLSWPALLLALNLLLPAVTGRIEMRLTSVPRQAFLTGLVVMVVLLLLAAMAIEAGSGLVQGVGYLLVGLLLALWLLGGAGLARLVGHRMGSLSDQSELSHLTRGTAVFVLAAFCPIVGWFLFFPFTALMAIGAAALGWRYKRNQPEPSVISVTQG